MNPEGAVSIEVTASGVGVAWVVACGCKISKASPQVTAALETVDTAEDQDRLRAVRSLLRHGRYRPSGRGKPAWEYLLAAARSGDFPRINDVVDLANLVSLSSRLPISLVDLDLAGCDLFRVRRGRAGEDYPFNPSGQVLALEDLLLLSGLPADRPIATPVKDSQATKTHDATTAVLAVIYAPRELIERAVAAAEQLAGMLTPPAFCVVGSALASGES